MYDGLPTYQAVRNICVAINKPPSFFDTNYVLLLSQALSYLLQKEFDVAAQIHIPLNDYVTIDQSRMPNTGETGASLIAKANWFRNQIFDIVDKVNGFIAKAKNLGFAPEQNPFIRIAQLQVNPDDAWRISSPEMNENFANEVLADIVSYLRLYYQDLIGNLRLSDSRFASAQLVSVGMGLEAYGGTGDTLADMARLLPSGDEIKRQQALDILAAFDFSKRVPDVIFTADYKENGKKGVLIGWRRIPDAAGYVVKKRELFTDNKTEKTLTNTEMDQMSQNLQNYVKTWILSFYADLDPNSVLTYLDELSSPNEYYLYKIQAFQYEKTLSGKVFSAETVPAVISNTMKQQIRTELETLDPGTGPDTISIYPIISHFLLGDAKYDWLLAGLNSRKSIERGDPLANTRSFSYIAAQLDFIFAQADLGHFVVPKNMDVNPILANMKDSIAKYGIYQTLNEILEDTGVLFFFQNKDVPDGTTISSDNQKLDEDSPLIKVLSDVDPKTLLLDTKSLATNLKSLLSGEYVSLGDNLTDSSPSEITVNFDYEKRVMSGISYLQAFDSENEIDVSTPEGIGSLLRIIRIFTDIGPAKGTSAINDLTPPEVDPITEMVQIIPLTGTTTTMVVDLPIFFP